MHCGDGSRALNTNTAERKQAEKLARQAEAGRGSKCQLRKIILDICMAEKKTVKEIRGSLGIFKHS